LARAASGADRVLADLRERAQVVAIISGRPSDQLRALIDVPGVELVGLYGMAEGQGRDRIEEAAADVAALAGLVPGAWVEDKASSLAVHYRAAEDPVKAGAVLVPAFAELTKRYDLFLFEGKMVVEVAAGHVPGKGSVIEGMAVRNALAGCLYAGDDLPDLDAFAALDRMAGERVTVKVAVRTEETPGELIAAADVVVDRPAGLLRLLSGL
jgi:trehalose 6-phosphate phosphatase